MTTSKPTTSKRVSSLLINGSTGLQNVLEKAAILRQLTHSLRQSLTAPLNMHVCIANIRNQTLVVGADSSAWLTKARFHSSAILKLMRQETGLKLTKVHFKVINSSTQNDGVITRHASMSDSAAMLLESTARGIQDPDLKQAMQRLSKNSDTA